MKHPCSKYDLKHFNLFRANTCATWCFHACCILAKAIYLEICHNDLSFRAERVVINSKIQHPCPVSLCHRGSTLLDTTSQKINSQVQSDKHLPTKSCMSCAQYKMLHVNGVMLTIYPLAFQSALFSHSILSTPLKIVTCIAMYLASCTERF